MKTITIGRDSNNDIVINDSSVSREHALILINDINEIILKDLNSSNGTFINGQRIKESKIKKEDKVRFGVYDFDIESYLKKVLSNETIISNDNKNDIKKKYTIGRSPSNDIVISSSDVSLFHAEILLMGNDEVYVADKLSTNGTMINGVSIEKKQIKKGDILTVASTKVSWETLVYDDISNSTVTRAKKSKKIQFIKKMFKPLTVAITLFVFLFGFIFLKQVFRQDIMEKYGDSVVFLRGEYIYVIDMGVLGEKEITVQNNEPVEYIEGKNAPIAYSATGFFISKDGKVITNRHVIYPWEYSDDKELINKINDLGENYIAKIIADQNEKLMDALINKKINGSDRNMNDLVKNEHLLKSINPKITGKLLSIAAGMNNTYIRNREDLIGCIPINDSGNKEIDVAMIQIKNKRLPPEVKNLIDINNAITEKKELHAGMRLVMIGYPQGQNLGETYEGIKSHYQEGILTREPDELSFGHNLSATHGSSGSPVLTDQGQLVGVMNSGVEFGTTFNFAILSKYAKKLTE